jgi:excisionase family DNA binding protein
MKEEKEYYTSKEAKKILKVSDCKLMHLREEGKIKAVKKGRAFLYKTESLEYYMAKLNHKIPVKLSSQNMDFR